MHEFNGGAAGTPADRQPDPDYAPTVEIFDQMPYDEIYRGVLQLNPEVLTAGRQAWQSAADGLSDAVHQMHAEVRGAVAEGWRGSAAAQAVGAMQAFEELGQHVADVMSTVGQRLGQANDAAETLRSTVTKPMSAQPDLQAALLDPKRATVNVADLKQAEGVRQDIVRVMNTVYTGAFLSTGNGVPAFHEGGMYPAPGAPVPAPGGATGPDPSSSLTGPSAESVPASEAPRASAAQQPAGSPEPATAGASASESTAPAAAAPNSTTPVATAPTATTPTASITPAGSPASVDGVSAAVADRPTATPAAAGTSGVPESAPVTVAPSGASAPVTIRPATATTPAQSAGEQGKNQGDRDQQHRDPTPDTVGGMGAGVVGGLAGGAFAASDGTRSGASVPVPPKRSAYDEDEDEFDDFGEPTFLDPAEPGSDLVGSFEPTTPPVVGEWDEDD